MELPWRLKVGTEAEIIKKKVRDQMATAKPNNSALWSRAKSAAKKKFDVYPSAYANAWASKWYKSKGGGWSGGNNKVASSGKSKSKKT